MTVGVSSSSNVVDSNWSHLPKDISKEIINRLNNSLDFGSSHSCALSLHNMILCSVCKSWNSSIPLRDKKLVVLPSDIDPDYNLRKIHYSLSQSTIYLLQEPQPQQPSSTTSDRNFWLLRVGEEKSSDGITSSEKWGPLNPHTRTLTSDDDKKKCLLLPNGFPKSVNLLDFRLFEIGSACSLNYVDQTSQTNSFDEDEFVRIYKIVVSSTAFTTENTDYAASSVDCLVVMAICGLKLVFHKLGDDKWIPVDDPTDYQGTAFSVGCDLKVKEIVPGLGYLADGDECKNLLTSGGGLFMIDSFFDFEPSVLHDHYINEYIVQHPKNLQVNRRG